MYMFATQKHNIYKKNIHVYTHKHAINTPGRTANVNSGEMVNVICPFKAKPTALRWRHQETIATVESRGLITYHKLPPSDNGLASCLLLTNLKTMSS